MIDHIVRVVEGRPVLSTLTSFFINSGRSTGLVINLKWKTCCVTIEKQFARTVTELGLCRNPFGFIVSGQRQFVSRRQNWQFPLARQSWSIHPSNRSHRTSRGRPVCLRRSRPHLRLWLVVFILTGEGWFQPLPAALAQSGGTAASENQAANDPGSLDPQENGLSEGRSTFWWLIETSGWIGLALLIISLYFVAKVTQCFLELRESVLMPPKFVARCHQLIAEREFTTLLATAKAENSEIGRVLTTAFSGLSIGIAEAREAVDRVPTLWPLTWKLKSACWP